ncbi:MAG: response regulator, partial [bacterium]
TNREYYKTLIGSKDEATFLADTAGDLYLLNKKAQSLSGYSEDGIRDYHVRDLFVTTKKSGNPFDSPQLTEFSASLCLLSASRYLIPVMLEFREIEGQKFLCTCVETREEVSRGEDEAGERTFSGNKKEMGDGGWEDKIFGQVDRRIGGQEDRRIIEFEHRARNLLGNMLGFGSILSRDPAVTGNKTLAVYIDSLLKSGTRLKELFNRFTLGESDAHEVTRTPIPMGSLLQKAVILLDASASQHNQVIRISSRDELKVLSDELLLLEVVKFLIEKAILYSRKEEILLEIKKEPEGKVTLVIDNVGQDIPQEVIGFIRRESGRESYDLNSPAIGRSPEIRSMLNTLNRIEGKITFKTGEGMGEIAYLILPEATGDEGTDDLAGLEEEIRARSLRILIVEDEKVTARILDLFLGGIAEVSLAYSGNEALNIIEILYGKGILFDLVIMDIGLPAPWDGMLLKKEIEKRWPSYRDIPFLAQTAFTSRDYQERIAGSDFREQLIKPVNRRELLLSVKRFCNR